MGILVYVDGACRDNGRYADELGHGAIGVVIINNSKVIGHYGRGLGRVNNNLAELEAILHGLLLCWAADLRDPIIYSDSMVAVNAVNKKVDCATPEFFPLLSSIWQLQHEFRFRLVHTPRTDPGIQQADAIANLTLDTIASDWHLPVKRRRNRKRP